MSYDTGLSRIGDKKSVMIARDIVGKLGEGSGDIYGQNDGDSMNGKDVDSSRW